MIKRFVALVLCILSGLGPISAQGWFPLGTPFVTQNIASRGQAYIGRASSNGTKTRLKNRLAFHIWHSASRIKFVYGNKYLVAATGEANGSNSISIRKAAAEKSGTFLPITWSGASSFTVAIGDTNDQSDWIQLPVAIGDTVWHRAEEDIASGTNTFVISKFYSTSESEQSWLYDPANEVDDVYGTGSMTAPSGALVQTPYAPLLLVGEVAPGTVAVIGVGDSIAEGTTDEVTQGLNGGGFMRRAVWQSSLPMASAALTGQKGNDFNAGHTLIVAMAAYHTDCLSNFGSNDILAGSTAAQVITNSNSILKLNWATLAAALQGRARVYQANILQRATSTDKGVNPANQTPVAGFGAGQVLDPVNTAIAAAPGANSLYAVIDVKTPTQDPTNSYVWKARTFTASLTQAAVSGANTVLMNAAPTLLEAITFDPTNASGQLGPTTAWIARTVTGSSSPFTVSTSGINTIGVAQNSGNAVAGTPSYDTVHPEPLIAALMATPTQAALQR